MVFGFSRGEGETPGEPSLWLARRLGDDSRRDTVAGWPDLINRSHALSGRQMVGRRLDRSQLMSPIIRHEE